MSESPVVIYFKKLLSSPLFWIPFMGALDVLIPRIPNIDPILWPTIKPILYGMLAVAGVVLTGIQTNKLLKARKHMAKA